MRVLTRAALAAYAFIAAATTASAQQPTSPWLGPPIPTLSLSAEGKVRAVPDTALVSLGVVEQADTADAALDRNNEAMRKLMSALEAAGIAARDIGTSSFSIEPVMVYPEPKGDGTQEPPRIVGYRVSNQVAVKIRDIGRTGNLLDEVVRIGANQVQGVSFRVDDDRLLLDRARGEAMKEVQAKAKLYATTGNFALGRVLSITEGVAPQPFPPPMARMAMASDKAESVPLAPGEQELTVTVNVSWEILPRP